MSLLLLFGLALVGAAGVLVLRSFALGRTGHRRTLEQIAAYGFRTAESPDDEGATHVRETLAKLAAATGERALTRFERLRSREQELRRLLTSAGMYGTSVASFVGLRILAALVGPGLLLLLSLNGALQPRLLFAGVVLTLMGWYLPYVIVHRRGRRGFRGRASACLAQHRGPPRPGAPTRAPRAEPRPDSGGSVAKPCGARGQPGDAGLHAGARTGRVARRLDRDDPPRARDRYAKAAAPGSRGACTEDADEDPVPADRPDPPGAVHHDPRPGAAGDREVPLFLVNRQGTDRVAGTTPVRVEPGRRPAEYRAMLRNGFA